MAIGVHSAELSLPINSVWNFISSPEKWASLVPGYISHETINEKEIIWVFTGDFGFIKKAVKVKVEVTELIDPSKITFNLTGISDTFAGSGFFQADALEPEKTRLTGSLDISGTGFMAPMINSMLKDFVPKTVTGHTDAVASKLAEQENVNI